MDRTHHQWQSRVDKGSGFFGVKPFDEGGGAFEVSEESGDGLAFTLSGAAGLPRRLFSENPFRQMRGRVAGWGFRVKRQAREWGGPLSFTFPDKPPPFRFGNLRMSKEQLFLEICEILVV